MKETIFLIGAMKYSMPDEKTGVINEGVSIAYVMTSDMAAKADKDNYGYRVVKGSVGTVNLKELTAVPGFYEADFDVRPDASGKAVLKPTSIKYKKAASL